METLKKGTGKKALLAIGVLAAVVAVFAVIYYNFGPKASEGTKEITIEVVDDQGESTVYNVKTDAAYLRQAMEEADGLTIEGAESDYGLMVDTVNGVTADYNTNGAYWAFYVNGAYCSYGIEEQPVVSGQEFQIVYTTEEEK